jgi:hypothetical protein
MVDHNESEVFTRAEYDLSNQPLSKRVKTVQEPFSGLGSNDSEHCPD